MAVIGRRLHFRPLIQRVAKQHAVNPELLEAIVQCESDFNPWAMRYEPKYSYETVPAKFAMNNRISVATEVVCQKMSWGLAQIMGGTARWMGYGGALSRLCEPELNLQMSCRYLQKLNNQYPFLEDMIAAYNAGSARKKGDEYVNQQYVDKVLAAMSIPQDQ